MDTPSSIKALTEGLKDGGISCFYNFPGFQSHIIFNELGGKQISINERVAFESAYGASLAGKRSAVTCKGAGLNVASDVFLHAVLNGINAGIVLILSDDVEAQGSPEKQDSRPYKDIFGGLWLEPTSVQQAYDFGRCAFEWSERFDIPVVIRLTNQFFTLLGDYQKKSAFTSNGKLKHEREKYISYWKIRNDNLKEKNRSIRIFVDDCYKSVEATSMEKTGILCIGNCQRELQKYQEYKDILNIFTYPLPINTINKFIEGKSKIIVLEQGIDYAAREIRAIVSDEVEVYSDTGDEIDRSDCWMTFDTYEKIFKALKKNSPSFVVGDEGSFTDETTKTIEACLCMGSSVGITMGLAENGVEYPFCIIGDTSFQFAGKQTIEESIHKGIPFGVILLDNGGAQTTGGQKKVGDIYDVQNVVKKIVKYEDTSEEEFEEIIKGMQDSHQLTILYVQM